MPDCRVQLFLAFLCGLISIAMYHSQWWYNFNGNRSPKDCELVKSLEKGIKSKLNLFAFIPCESTKITSVESVGCPCPGEPSTNDCAYATICILWKETPGSDILKSTVESVSRDVKFITSSKLTPKGAVSHFFVHLHNGRSVHFVNWFEQEDGSWWFDQLPSNVQPTTATNTSSYIGKYEGWVPRFRLLERPGSSGLDEPVDWDAFRRRLRHSRFVACDRQRAHQFHLAEGRDVSTDAERFRHRAWRLLAAATDALDQLDVPFWLSSGTCLGYYRQCDFVPYMGDVDIGVRTASVRDWSGDVTLPSLAQLEATLAARRLRLVHRFGLPEDSLELSFRSPDDIKLDIFFFYEDGDVMWNGGTQARTGRKFRYDFAAFELCWTEFRDLRVRVPCDTERYLESNYGPDWRRPQPEWDWKSSPPNVRENGVWTAEQRPRAVQLLEP